MINSPKQLNAEVKPGRSSSIYLKCFRSITEVDENLWESINRERDIFHSHKFLSCLEKSEVEQSCYWYLVFYKKDEPVGSAVLTLFTISLDLLSSNMVSRFCNLIRKFFPGFMKIKFLFCGTPISIGKNNLKITNKTLTRCILDSLVHKMIALAEEHKLSTLCLKEFNEEHCESMSSVSSLGFIKAPSIPYVSLNLDEKWSSFQDYLGAMRSPFRRQINQNLAKLFLHVNKPALPEDGGNNTITPRIEVKSPCPADAAVFHKLYLEVMQRAKNKMEILNKQFFENIFGSMQNFSLISLKDKDEVLGSALICRDNDVMTFLLIGMDYDKMKKYDTYFNLVYKVISQAIKERFRILDMGQTSYYFKQRCGGVCEERYFYIKSLNKPVHFLLSAFKSQLFPTTHINSLQVFRPQTNLYQNKSAEKETA